MLFLSFLSFESCRWQLLVLRGRWAQNRSDCIAFHNPESLLAHATLRAGVQDGAALRAGAQDGAALRAGAQDGAAATPA